MLKTLHMHTSFVFSICLYEIQFENEKRIMVASGGGDSYIYVWDIQQLQYDKEYVVRASYKPIRLSLQQGKEMPEGKEPEQYTTKQLEFNHYVPVYRQNTEMLVLCMVQCDKYLIAGYNSNEVIRWSLELKNNNNSGIIKEKKNEQFLLNSHNDSVNALDATQDLIASGGDDLCLMIQDLKGQLVIKYYCDEPVDLIKFESPDQIVFATNQHIFILKLENKKIKFIKQLILEEQYWNIIQLCCQENISYFATLTGIYSMDLKKLKESKKIKDKYFLFEQKQESESESDFIDVDYSIESIYQMPDQNEFKGLYFSKNNKSLYCLTNKSYFVNEQQPGNEIPLKQSGNEIPLQQSLAKQNTQQQQQEIQYSENYEQILQQILVTENLIFIGGDLFRFMKIQQQQ